MNPAMNIKIAKAIRPFTEYVVRTKDRPFDATGFGKLRAILRNDAATLEPRTPWQL